MPKVKIHSVEVGNARFFIHIYMLRWVECEPLPEGSNNKIEQGHQPSGNKLNYLPLKR